jgi:hypothetical protein
MRALKKKNALWIEKILHAFKFRTLSYYGHSGKLSRDIVWVQRFNQFWENSKFNDLKEQALLYKSLTSLF